MLSQPDKQKATSEPQFFRLGQCHFEHGCIINRWLIELWKLYPQSIGLLLPVDFLVGSQKFEMANVPGLCCS
jgi:hypothetical protein